VQLHRTDSLFYINKVKEISFQPLNFGVAAMSVNSTLQLAADAIEDARKRLERARVDADDDYEIRQALRHLEEASDYLRKASNELKQQKG
jgi:hypothetical protein